MIIRSEKPSDIETIAEVTKVAFEHHSFSHQTEHFIIRDLRDAVALTISLVAEVDGQVEKDAITDVIIDYDIAGMSVDLANPAIESLIEKEILTEMPDGKFMMRPSALAEYDSYFGQVSQFRATEMSRVHKNPIMAAIKS
jgi:hypothetical protein